MELAVGDRDMESEELMRKRPGREQFWVLYGEICRSGRRGQGQSMVEDAGESGWRGRGWRWELKESNRVLVVEGGRGEKNRRGRVSNQHRRSSGGGVAKYGQVRSEWVADRYAGKIWVQVFGPGEVSAIRRPGWHWPN